MNTDDLPIGARLINAMDRDIKDASDHICLKKLCNNNHFCIFDKDHIGKCYSISCLECKK